MCVCVCVHACVGTWIAKAAVLPDALLTVSAILTRVGSTFWDVVFTVIPREAGPHTVTLEALESPQTQECKRSMGTTTFPTNHRTEECKRSMGTTTVPTNKITEVCEKSPLSGGSGYHIHEERSVKSLH